MAFFLAPNGSRIPENSGGGSLGLTGPFNYNMSTTENPFIAVEFDIFRNAGWDLPGRHDGLDIQSMRSDYNVRWLSNTSIMEGWQQEATISYTGQAKNLSVVFGYWVDGTWITQGSFSFPIDLRTYLPEFVTFGFSAATGDLPVLFTLYSWNFSSILIVNGNETVITPSVSNSGKRKIGTLVIALPIGGCLLFVLALALLMYCFWRKKKTLVNGVYKKTFDVSISHALERVSGPKNYAYDDLKCATNNFAQQEKLGEGGFGGVYKGFIREMDLFIAVKRVSSGSQQGVKEYVSEVKIISRLRHRNLVQILGWCHERQELLLVYEFMPNGSLDSHLFKGKSLLSWAIRFKIAQGLSYALLYLHDEWEQCVLHRDIKSSNIMLDTDFNAKLGDFGLARLIDHGKGYQTIVLAGTMGYMAPECMITGKASKQTNVFSFGMVALEIATGRRSIDIKAEERQVNLVEWVWHQYGTGRLLEVADPLLDACFNLQEME